MTTTSRRTSRTSPVLWCGIVLGGTIPHHRTGGVRVRVRVRVRRAGAIAAVALIAASCTTTDRTDASKTATTARPGGTSTTVATTTAPASTVPAGGAEPSGFVPGTLGEPQRVGPAPGSELDGIDRDAGISVRLRDDSTLWLFGDTARANDDGSLAYFVIGTAAWARPGSPTVTVDYASGGVPVAFATPIAGFPPCPGEAPVPGMWPSSAVVQPVGNLDRVIVWMENICLGSTIRGAARGMAVAEWFYDPTAPPTDLPIQGRILNQTLFPQRSFGLASVVDGDGAITYSCTAPEQGGAPDAYGPCTAARVSLDDVANPSAYRTWDGSGWNGDVLTAQPLVVEADGAGPQYPAGSFSIVADASLHRYVMVYSPWPGYSDALQIRTSATPTGPWSAPTTVPLPGCSDQIGTSTFWCYAAAVQPIFSRSGQLGVGWYDRRVSSGPVRGSYVVATLAYTATG